jgi:hypothetical protein
MFAVASLQPSAETRLIFPYNVERQRVSVICPGGDYTFMRNTVPITDSQPNVPSAMFPATADHQKAVASYSETICSVAETTKFGYRQHFAYWGSDIDKTEKRGVGPSFQLPLSRQNTAP